MRASFLKKLIQTNKDKQKIATFLSAMALQLISLLRTVDVIRNHPKKRVQKE